MENTTKILILPIIISGNLIEEKESFDYSEFPYKHLLPKVEAA
jgi:hypothetical protein